jgi:hypothetical protein
VYRPLRQDDLGINNFQFRGLTAELEFETSDSYGFRFFTDTTSPVRTVKGWLSVHYPCQGHVKLYCQGALSREYLDGEGILELARVILEYLALGEQTTYEIRVDEAGPGYGTGQYRNEQGYSDRLSSFA